jgi:type VI protein secretion system component VasK
MDTIPPFIQQVLGALVRVAVVWVAGVLFARAGVTVTEDQIGQAVAYLVPVVFVLGWSLYQKYRGRLKFLIAAGSPHVMTEHEVEAIVRDPAKPCPPVNTPKNELPR